MKVRHIPRRRQRPRTLEQIARRAFAKMLSRSFAKVLKPYAGLDFAKGGAIAPNFHAQHLAAHEYRIYPGHPLYDRVVREREKQRSLGVNYGSVENRISVVTVGVNDGVHKTPEIVAMIAALNEKMRARGLTVTGRTPSRPEFQDLPRKP